LAVNTRRRNGSTGTWEEKPNYFDVTVRGAQAENCERYLSKGRPVAVDGRLEWREFEARDGSKRQAVEIIAETVQFLGPASDAHADPRAHAREPDSRPAVVQPPSAVSQDEIPF
jgi:single-strand DNA-binding protein